MLVIAFRIAVKLDVNNVFFVVRWLFECTNGIKMQILGVVGLLLKLLFYSQKNENIFSFVCALWTRSTVMISGTQIYFTLSEIMTVSPNFERVIS